MFVNQYLNEEMVYREAIGGVNYHWLTHVIRMGILILFCKIGLKVS